MFHLESKDKEGCPICNGPEPCKDHPWLYEEHGGEG